jgi:hypothetical protein
MILIYCLKTYILYEKHRSFISRVKEVGIEVNAGKTKYMFMYRVKYTEQHPSIKTGNKSCVVQMVHIWELHEQLKITYVKNLRTDYIRGMPAVSPSRIFCLPVSCLKL